MHNDINPPPPQKKTKNKTKKNCAFYPNIYERFKRTQLIRTKHKLRTYRVIPFIKLQNNI